MHIIYKYVVDEPLCVVYLFYNCTRVHLKIPLTVMLMHIILYIYNIYIHHYIYHIYIYYIYSREMISQNIYSGHIRMNNDRP